MQRHIKVWQVHGYWMSTRCGSLVGASSSAGVNARALCSRKTHVGRGYVISIVMGEHCSTRARSRVLT